MVRRGRDGRNPHCPIPRPGAPAVPFACRPPTRPYPVGSSLAAAVAGERDNPGPVPRRGARASLAQVAALVPYSYWRDAARRSHRRRHPAAHPPRPRHYRGDPRSRSRSPWSGTCREVFTDQDQADAFRGHAHHGQIRAPPAASEGTPAVPMPPRMADQHHHELAAPVRSTPKNCPGRSRSRPRTRGAVLVGGGADGEHEARDLGRQPEVDIGHLQTPWATWHCLMRSRRHQHRLLHALEALKRRIGRRRISAPANRSPHVQRQRADHHQHEGPERSSRSQPNSTARLNMKSEHRRRRLR